MAKKKTSQDETHQIMAEQASTHPLSAVFGILKNRARANEWRGLGTEGEKQLAKAVAENLDLNQPGPDGLTALAACVETGNQY